MGCFLIGIDDKLNLILLNEGAIIIMDEILSDVLKKIESETTSLSLRQKFVLFTVPDKKLTQNLVKKKYNLLFLLGREFESNDLKNFYHDRDASLENIFNAIKQLEELAVFPDTTTTETLFSILKEKLRQDELNYSSATLYDIRKILKKLSDIQPAQYETAVKICNILDIKKTIENDDSIQIDTESTSETYYKICSLEDSKQSILSIIENELLTFEYALSPSFNEEILFCLSYADEKALHDYAPKIHEIIKKRTLLYNNMYSALPPVLQPDIKKFSVPFPGTYRIDDRDFLYNKLRLIINNYQSWFNPLLDKEPNQAPSLALPKLNLHLRTIMKISKDTDLLNIQASDRTNLDFLMSTFDITQGNIAKVLGITPAAVSQQKQKGPLKIHPTRLWELARIFNSSVDFWQEKTTIPSYGKIFPNIDDLQQTDDEKKYTSYLEGSIQRVATTEKLLSYFELQINKNKDCNQNLYKQEQSLAILEIIGCLKQKISNPKYPTKNLKLIGELIKITS